MGIGLEELEHEDSPITAELTKPYQDTNHIGKQVIHIAFIYLFMKCIDVILKNDMKGAKEIQMAYYL